MREPSLPSAEKIVWCWPRTRESAEGSLPPSRYSILSRDFSKIHKLSDNVYLLTSGMIADTQALRTKLSETIDGYEYKMFKKPDLHPSASLLCTLPSRQPRRSTASASSRTTPSTCSRASAPKASRRSTATMRSAPTTPAGTECRAAASR